MKVWFDCNTTKQALLFSTIALRLKKKGYDYRLTCRDYDVAPSLLDKKGVEYTVLGKHGGGTLEGKLLASTERTKLLANHLIKAGEKPDFAVYLNSPEAARVAFGLSIPAICLNDTPHAKAIITLVIPFSNYVILPTFIPFKPYSHLTSREKVVRYDGIDAIEMFREFSPTKDVLSSLNLDPTRKIVVFRPEEAFASYYPSSSNNPLPVGEPLLQTLTSKFPTCQFVVFPRYEEQKEMLRNKFGKKISIPEQAVDTRSLEAFSDLVITGGSTIAEEAAVQGTPAISYFPEELYRWQWLQKKKFPGFHLRNVQKAIEKAIQILNDSKKFRKDTSQLLVKLESPGDKLIEILEGKSKK